MTLRWARRRNRVLVLVSAAVDLASAVDVQHEMVAMKMAKAPTDALILLYVSYFCAIEKEVKLFALDLAQPMETKRNE